MNVFLLLLSIISFFLNLNAPTDLSYANKLVLCVEFVGVILIGKMIIDGVLQSINHTYQKKLYGAFLLFLSLTLLYLHFCWTPNLSINNENWGFDPQRYYYYATQIIRSSGFEFALNYVGVVYIYVFLMSVLGIDPLVPLFVNVLLVVLTVSIITKGIYVIYGKNSYYRYTWLFFLFPEVIYYSAVSSREIFCLALVSICIYIAASQSLDDKRTLIRIIALIGGLLIVRPPFAAALVLALLLSPIKNKVALGAIGFLAIVISVIGGGLDFGSSEGAASLADSLTEHVSGNVAASDSYNYGENSIARRLIPHNPVEFVIFGIIRSLLYLLPKTLPFPIIASVFASSHNMGSLLGWLSSFIIMLSIPSLWGAFREFKTQDSFSRVVFTSFCVFFFVVGMLNSNLIQERYRLVYDFLLLSVWLLYKQKNKKKQNEIKRVLKKHIEK